MSATALTLELKPSVRDVVWYGDEVATASTGVSTSGFEALDAVLPGGGWPVGAMTEILHAGPETFAWPLLLPALGPAVSARRRPVLLVGAPHLPFGPALAAQGLPPAQLLWVRSQAAAARLWACEQALRCADVAAVLAWLPQARPAELRRLQLAAAQHDALLWVFRPAAAAGSSAPARLRIRVEAGGEHGSVLELHILKRRGPPLERPVQVPAHPPRLSALIAASRLGQRWQGTSPAAPPASPPSTAKVVRLDFQGGVSGVAAALRVRAVAPPAAPGRPTQPVLCPPVRTNDGPAGDTGATDAARGEGDALARAAVAA
ncbi:translesion DNA synthesis-associated protein ImuA [Xylophilus sp. Leaf220]|uniref:translesion DNA synthesis-associated protein ImuA n=1 Tax=Xylophilus sp. Leaf220 TaxID=1735686 RepID=UPI000AE05B7D|nr:translesion DNA synthesis-associated protein ImuA [Xylophilus sp. Leaf220]